VVRRFVDSLVVNTRRPSWTRIVIGALCSALFMTLVGGLTHRYVGHRGFAWDESIAVGAIWLVLVPVLGAIASRQEPGE
jgi:TRAP-type C4-dicarboxylate transport system permease small subunit